MSAIHNDMCRETFKAAFDRGELAMQQSNISPVQVAAFDGVHNASEPAGNASRGALDFAALNIGQGIGEKFVSNNLHQQQDSLRRE